MGIDNHSLLQRLALPREQVTHIFDAAQLTAFIDSLDVKIVAFEADNNSNLIWRVKMKNSVAILSVEPALTETKRAAYTEQNVLLASEQLIKVKVICDAIYNTGFPCVRIWRTGFNSQLNRAWRLQAYAAGTNLAQLWCDLTQSTHLSLARQIGELLPKLHQLDARLLAAMVGERPSESIYAWYEQRAEIALQQCVELRLYRFSEINRIERVLNTLNKSNYATARRLSPIHGDISLHNLFVKKQNREGDWRVSAVTDWESCLAAGDPHYDLCLAAWRIAGEQGGSREIFEAVIAGYNATSAETQRLDPAQIDHAVALADLTWHLNALPHTYYQRRLDDLERRKANIERLVSTIFVGRPYLNLISVPRSC